MDQQTRLNNEGEQHVGRHDYQAAQKCFEAAVRLGEMPEALLNLSYLHSRTGDHTLAQDFALRALKARPEGRALKLRMMNRLRHFNLSGDLRDYIHGVADIDAWDAQSLHSVAAHLSSIGLNDESLARFDLAISRNPNVPPLYLARAQVRMFLGQFEESEQDLVRVLHGAPGSGQAYWTLAQLRTQTADANHVDAIRNQIRNTPHSSREFPYLLYALHKELDDLGDSDAAADALAKACAAKRVEQNYTSSETDELIRRLRDYPWHQASPGTQGAADEDFTPVFIVGMFRSGTTLLERLLCGNPEVSGAGELLDFTSCLQYFTGIHCRGVIDSEMTCLIQPRSDLARVGEAYRDRVRWRLGEGKYLVDKMPANFLNVGFILRAMPNARIIHMVRDPMATCFSNLRELFSGASPYSYVQEELADYFVNYRKLMACWHQAFPGRIHDVTYAELTGNTATAMRGVAAFCGMDYLDEMTDTASSKGAVATASVVQARQPVKARKVEKWEAYRDHLQPLMQRLAQGGVTPE